MIICSILSSTLCILQDGCIAENQEEKTIVVNATNKTFVIRTTVDIVDPMPVSEYIQEYNMTKTGYVWRAINGSSYIDPDHEVVQWYACNTVLNETGLYYLNGDMVKAKFHPDFNYENEDHWMNADYYLSHNLTGDCEDFAIGIASILEAKGIPNMVVAISNRRDYGHSYLEYYFNGSYYICDFKHPQYQIRGTVQYAYSEVWMFNINHNYMTYYDDWYNIIYNKGRGEIIV